MLIILLNVYIGLILAGLVSLFLFTLVASTNTDLINKLDFVFGELDIYNKEFKFKLIRFLNPVFHVVLILFVFLVLKCDDEELEVVITRFKNVKNKKL